MITMYAYTYPHAMQSLLASGYILAKVGDTHREADTRINEQGRSAEWEAKVRVGSWPNLKIIKRDHDVHRVLTKLGLWHSGDHQGTEWFKIPGQTIDDVRKYIDAVITAMEGGRVRKSVKLRQIQQRTLDQAMDIIANAGDAASLIANLCPRFGKTIWALSLFNRITEKYSNRVMLLPAYWLSVHSSFIEELDEYADFNDIVQIDTDEPDAATKAADALTNGLRIVVPISLHGDLEAWKLKHQFIAELANDDIYMFADEGDFGTHTDNQAAKLQYLFDN
jgi:hypothetical protein